MADIRSLGEAKRNPGSHVERDPGLRFAPPRLQTDVLVELMTILRTLVLLLLPASALLTSTSISALEDNTLEAVHLPAAKIQTALRWSLLPGAGHWYLGDETEAQWYMGSTVALLGSGLWLEERNDDLNRDEVNLPLIMLLKGWELSVFTTYRSALTKSGFDLNASHVDDTSVKNLLQAPFEWQNISDPWVWGAALFGSLLAVLESGDHEKKFSDIERVDMLGDDANQAWGTGLYTTNAFAISLGAGVGEEALWRGVLQNQLEHRYGEDNGLWAASALFGSAHLVGIDGSANVEGALFATAGGYYLGHLYQRNGYRLAKPIAAHFWFDFAAIVTSFLIDPENNPFGVDVSYDF